MARVRGGCEGRAYPDGSTEGHPERSVESLCLTDGRGKAGGMADDYVKTAERMMADAQTLRRVGAHRNACYLAGYVVECTLKALLQVAGTSPRPVHDLESLHEDVELLRIASNAVVARYGDPSTFAPTMLHQVRPSGRDRFGRNRYYCAWDPLHRYDGARWDSDAASEVYVREADDAMNTILNMMIDGVL